MWSPVPVGTYALQAFATDNRGARTASPIVNAVVAAAGVPIAFAGEQHYDTNASSGGWGNAAVGDVNRDGKVDLVLGTHDAITIQNAPVAKPDPRPNSLSGKGS